VAGSPGTAGTGADQGLVENLRTLDADEVIALDLVDGRAGENTAKLALHVG
jgi:hypothetical protein